MSARDASDPTTLNAGYTTVGISQTAKLLIGLRGESIHEVLGLTAVEACMLSAWPQGQEYLSGVVALRSARRLACG
jgi:hypothetical protein